MSKFIILSGPSCIGKSPLEKALKRLYPEWARQLQKLVLYNDRSPRPGEIDGVDYHFRPHHEVEAKKEREGYIVLQVRNDLQALEIESIQRIQEAGKIPFFEGNPYLVEALQETGLFSRYAKTSIFMSPLSRDEIHFFRETDFDMEKLIALIMRKKQLRRKQKQMNLLSIPDLEDVEIRCQAAYKEMKLAHHYDYVIPNHDGEDSENWSDFYYPVGDARKAVEAFVSILKEEPLPYVEQWQKDLLA